MTPADADGLRVTFAEVHRRYTGAINARFRWTGHLFQGRFGAVVWTSRICWRRRVTSLSIRRSRGW